MGMEIGAGTRDGDRDGDTGEEARWQGELIFKSLIINTSAVLRQC